MSSGLLDGDVSDPNIGMIISGALLAALAVLIWSMLVVFQMWREEQWNIATQATTANRAAA